MPTIAEGNAVPEFDLPEAGGGMFSRASMAGRPYVLFFYPKADTSGCTVEAIDFSRLRPEFDALGVTVAGVSPDPVKKLAKFRDKHQLTVTLASDEEQALLGPLGLWVEKSMYGRKYMGVERTTLLVGAVGRVARLWSKVAVPGHADAVLEAARGLLA